MTEPTTAADRRTGGAAVAAGTLLFASVAAELRLDRPAPRRHGHEPRGVRALPDHLDRRSRRAGGNAARTRWLPAAGPQRTHRAGNRPGRRGPAGVLRGGRPGHGAGHRRAGGGVLPALRRRPAAGRDRCGAARPRVAPLRSRRVVDRRPRRGRRCTASRWAPRPTRGTTSACSSSSARGSRWACGCAAPRGLPGGAGPGPWLRRRRDGFPGPLGRPSPVSWESSGPTVVAPHRPRPRRSSDDHHPHRRPAVHRRPPGRPGHGRRRPVDAVLRRVGDLRSRGPGVRQPALRRRRRGLVDLHGPGPRARGRRPRGAQRRRWAPALGKVGRVGIVLSAIGLAAMGLGIGIEVASMSVGGGEVALGHAILLIGFLVSLGGLADHRRHGSPRAPGRALPGSRAGCSSSPSRSASAFGSWATPSPRRTTPSSGPR